jgi:hypothetical protein
MWSSSASASVIWSRRVAMISSNCPDRGWRDSSRAAARESSWSQASEMSSDSQTEYGWPYSSILSMLKRGMVRKGSGLAGQASGLGLEQVGEGFVEGLHVVPIGHVHRGPDLAGETALCSSLHGIQVAPDLGITVKHGAMEL